MERKRNYIERAQDWADERLRRMCGRITPGKRLAVILVMFLLFGGLSVYITVSSIYHIEQTGIWKKHGRMSRADSPQRRRSPNGNSPRKRCNNERR